MERKQGECSEQCPSCSAVSQRALGNKMSYHFPLVALILDFGESESQRNKHRAQKNTEMGPNGGLGVIAILVVKQFVENYLPPYRFLRFLLFSPHLNVLVRQTKVKLKSHPC